MPVIKLSQNKEALVDIEDYERLNVWKWYYHQGYAIRKISLGNGKRKTIRMHNEILNPSDGLVVDHKDGNPLNNVRLNLRLASTKDNNRNRFKHKKCSSLYKGVLWHKRDERWQASIKVDSKQYHLGYFKSEIEAALAYNEAALKYFGEFARLNIIIT